MNLFTTAIAMVDTTTAAIAVVGVLTIVIIAFILTIASKAAYKELERQVLSSLGFTDWNIVAYIDAYVTVKSRQTLDKYDGIKFFKENKEKLTQARFVIEKKMRVTRILNSFLESNEYQTRFQYHHLEQHVLDVLEAAKAYRICVSYISRAGNCLAEKEIILKPSRIYQFQNDPSLLMGKAEYNKYLKDQQKILLSQKQREYYIQINEIIDYSTQNADTLVIKGSLQQLDGLVTQLFEKVIGNIEKIKTPDSQDWFLIEKFKTNIQNEIIQLVNKNQKISAYYQSSDFLKIKDTCNALMGTQLEFNAYITEKAQIVSQLFGVRSVRNETIYSDEYEYIRPYKKIVSPFNAEVSSSVFASAENNPLEYVVKYFYPDKSLYSEQIQKLCLLIEELETLRDAKRIIENYKAEYQQYLCDVPDYIMKEDPDGFYSRLGFADIDDSILAVEYTFSYTSGGGKAHRSFHIPMTEDTIADLIKALESKLSAAAFVKEQRTLMTPKMREFIKRRDNFTCCNCGNSTHKEPNLLLEIDHIIPVTKGGHTVEENLQTLCWKCNRAKGNKLTK